MVYPPKMEEYVEKIQRKNCRWIAYVTRNPKFQKELLELEKKTGGKVTKKALTGGSYLLPFEKLKHPKCKEFYKKWRIDTSWENDKNKIYFGRFPVGAELVFEDKKIDRINIIIWPETTQKDIEYAWHSLVKPLQNRYFKKYVKRNIPAEQPEFFRDKMWYDLHKQGLSLEQIANLSGKEYPEEVKKNKILSHSEFGSFQEGCLRGRKEPPAKRLDW